MRKEHYVFTGGAGVGKTTMGKEFYELGCIVGPEAARTIFRREMRKGEDAILPDKNPYEFQMEIFHKQVKVEKSIVGTGFLDRAPPDNIGYCRYFGMEIPQEILEYVRTGDRYAGVFLLSPLPRDIYTTDAERQESYDDSLRLQDLIHEAYIQCGYNPTIIPAYDNNGKLFTPTERAEYILGQIPHIAQEVGIKDAKPFKLF